MLTSWLKKLPYTPGLSDPNMKDELEMAHIQTKIYFLSVINIVAMGEGETIVLICHIKLTIYLVPKLTEY